MRILFSVLFLIQVIYTVGQNFHTSFSDYSFMLPKDFSIVNDGYIMAMNYGYTYNSANYSILVKTNEKGIKTHEYDFIDKAIDLYGVKPISDSVIMVYGQMDVPGKDYPVVYLALFNHELNIIKEFEFEATKIVSGMQSARASINNAGNIVCCISNYPITDYDRHGGYMLALNRDLDLLNTVFFSLKDHGGGLTLVDDIIPFKNSDTSLVIIHTRKAYLVDNLANIIDSVDNFLFYEYPDSNGNLGYRIGRTYAGAAIDDHIYVGGNALGSNEIGVAKFDKKMNRLKTRFFGELKSQTHTAYINTLTANDKYLYTANLSNWHPNYIYYNNPNYITVRKMDTALNLVWEKQYSADGWCYFPFSIRATPDGGFGLLATRNHYDTMGDQVEAYFIKADSLGNFDTTLVALKEVESVFKIYPNPGSRELNISYSADINGAVFSLYSISGTRVITKQIDLEHTTFSTTHLCQGMYVFELMKNGVAVDRGKWIKQ